VQVVDIPELEEEGKEDITRMVRQQQQQHCCTAQQQRKSANPTAERGSADYLARYDCGSHALSTQYAKLHCACSKKCSVRQLPVVV
jgi:hypothetical protein